MFWIRKAMLFPVVAGLLTVGTAAGDKAPQKIKGWGEVTDPDGDCKVQDEKGKVAIKIPGTYHDLWPGQGKVNAPRILQDAEGDFSVQVKVAGAIRPEKGSVIPNLGSSASFQAGSLLIWEDDNNFVRLDRACLNRGDKPVSFGYFHAFKDGKRVVHLSQDFQDRETYLRLERRDGQILAAVSQDGGKNWDSFRPQTVQLAKKLKVGVAALNNTKKPLMAEFEEFKLSPAGGDKEGK